MIAIGRKQDEELVDAAVDAFQLGSPESVCTLGGTATPKYAVQTPRGRFVIRVRPSEFADEDMASFDRQALARLAAAELPVPCPQYRPDGTSVLRIGNRVLEVLSWLGGEPSLPGDCTEVRNVGRFLARFHAALKDDVPCGKEGFLREDHPDLLLPYVRRIEMLCESPDEVAKIGRIGAQIEYVRRNLDNRLWPRLPKAVTHGDIHPGNLRFRNAHVAAVYDFDYLSVQARVHDIAHALMFFGGERDSVLDPDDIRSLTQAFRLDETLTRHLLGGYQEISSLTDLEWEAIPLVIRSVWAQVRLRGSRKVPEAERASYVLDRYFEVVDWLDQSAEELFEGLRMS
jgi:Ser/Thr protein kinase RdoA (MazF antagonist)